MKDRRNYLLSQQRKKEIWSRERLILRIVEKQLEAERRLAEKAQLEEKHLEELVRTQRTSTGDI